MSTCIAGGETVLSLPFNNSHLILSAGRLALKFGSTILQNIVVTVGLHSQVALRKIVAYDDVLI